ncbi:MAG: hypothetical protein ACRDKL_12625 [Solirubrobacteraceae bacterium]
MQKARYQEVASAITAVIREPHAVRVEFDEALNATTMHELVSAERDCCQSLSFEWDTYTRQLWVTVATPTMLPALDAIGAAFTQAQERIR